MALNPTAQATARRNVAKRIDRFLIVLDRSQPLTDYGGGDGPGEGSNDEIVTYRVAGPLVVKGAPCSNKRTDQECGKC